MPINKSLCADAGLPIKEDAKFLRHAKKIYEWVIANTFRYEGVKEGCGLALPICTIEEKQGGGYFAALRGWLTLARCLLLLQEPRDFPRAAFTA
ncbi:MAG: hypothetical protein IJG62_05095 [Synergistaceae bacterium]|nr:hypothetical protein [Synergistaceae bacterium]MBQ3625686.1 hypothetical protein [Synergistaceae bacterium]MBQ6740524.1 hypothetical protein [Synergistaceae bacterium]MBQ7569368.1 hypothetical protein [Synergistaceae bacterium]MBQ9581319.1 hypothetical protein [Synergistaceae bacterium]